MSAEGTAAGGRRIVKTMGLKITKLRPAGGFCAETAGAAAIFAAARSGIPASFAVAAGFFLLIKLFHPGF